jgi:hypothetical protein
MFNCAVADLSGAKQGCLEENRMGRFASILNVQIAILGLIHSAPRSALSSAAR